MEQVIEHVGRILGFLFGSYNERILKRYWKIVNDQINPLEEKIKALPDSEFPKLTETFKKRIADGETLEQILPEAFAAVREAARRTVNMRHFDVQLIGGVVLHEGKIAEMATGEGKTLVATLSAYLNSLLEKGVHIITVNDYLARRDTQWMGPIYNFMGITVGCLQHDVSFLYDKNYDPGPIAATHNLKPCERIDAYRASITYGTNNEFGFDYLRDNMKIRQEDVGQKTHYYGIVDEVDSILIDEARTPLIISGPAQESADKYYIADRISHMLRKGEDFEVKEKEHLVILSDKGIEKAQKLVGVDNFYTGDNMDWPHFIETALKAHQLYRRDKDYLIKDGEVMIVDEFTGRMMPGRRWSDGLHQAVEAKEGIRVREENQTLATITLQNYFRMYEKLAGMTGTAATEAAEFDKIYKLDVVIIPPNKKLIRNTYPDTIFASEEEKFENIANEIEKIHKTGRPTLVGTTSIEKSEYLSKLLKIRGITHEVLNAKHHEREAQIIAKAGQRSSVTISTNMAGRGTDIILGDGIASLGGLHVIGTERHEARRIDNQLRGRAGRQGDPGSNQFFLSLEDELFRVFAPPWLKPLMQKLGLKNGEMIESKMITKAIERAQKNVENRNFDIRKSLLEYDEIMNKQRQVIYSLRQKILAGDDNKEAMLEMIKGAIYAAIDKFLPQKDPANWDHESLYIWFTNKFRLPLGLDEIKDLQPAQVEEMLIDRVEQAYSSRESEIGGQNMREIERLILLDRIDEKWKDHLYNMDQLRDIIGLRSYGQMDPKLEYKREATEMFEGMMHSIREDVASLVFKVQQVTVAKEKMARRWEATQFVKQSMQTIGAGAIGQAQEEAKEVAKLKPIISAPKVGRNEPCPCGSGKKYKRCCGKSA